MCIKCIALVVLWVFNSRSFIIEDERLPENSITSSVISQFAEHDVIFHYDNETESHVYPIIAQAATNVSYLMINYDSPSSILHRPTGYKFIHVVLLQNYTRFSKYESANEFPLEYADISFFITDLGNEVIVNETWQFTYWKNHYLDRAGGLFIMHNLTMYTVCFYCGDESSKLKQIEELYEDASGIMQARNLHKYINKFTDFRGHEFRIGYSNFQPFFWCSVSEEKENSTVYDIVGSEGELLYLFNAKYNAEFQLTNFSNYTNGWTQLIKAVHNRSLDWAIGGITVTYKRSEFVDFSTSIQIEPYTVLYSVYEDPWMAWKNIILPFQLAIWVSLFASVLAISSLLYVSMKITGFETSMSFWYYIKGCLHCLVEQPLPRIPIEMRSRWTSLKLMSLWLCVALVMTNAYKSKLTSSLISCNTNEPESIDELVEDDFYFQIGNLDVSVLEENLGTSTDSKFLETLKRSSTDTNFCTSVRNSFRHKLGIIEEESYMQYTIQEDCRKLMSAEELRDLRIIKYELFPSQHSWAVQLSAPYLNSINTIINRLHAGGIFDKWNRDYYSVATKVPKSDHSHSNSKRARPKSTLTSILGPAFIWTLGMLAATLVFIVELIRRR